MRLTLLAIPFLIVLGCATTGGYHIRSRHDAVHGYTVHRFGEMPIGNGFFVDARRYIPRDGGATYSLIARYFGPHWVYISPGESLVLLVDGERLGFSGEGSAPYRQVVCSRFVYEEACYDVTFEQLCRIAGARNVTVDIRTEGGAFREMPLAAKDLEDLGRFTREYPPVAPSGARNR